MLRTFLTRAVIVLILAGVVFSPGIFRYFSLSPIQSHTTVLSENVAVIPKPLQPVYGLPVRLRISKINVDAAIEQVGLTSGGDMAAPTGNLNVGWYRFGSHPGNNGSAVIAGHYGRWGKSVFGKLHELAKGDKLQIEDVKGAVTTFVVRESRSFEPEADTAAVFGPSDGKAYLNLITCEGVWDEIAKTYSKRLVVFTEKE